MPIVALFEGEAGAGKDTTISGVWFELKKRGYDVEVMEECARDAKYKGFTLDKTTSINSQLYMLGMQVAYEATRNEKSKADFLLLNRSIIDVEVITTVNLPEGQAYQFQVIVSRLMRLLPYNRIYYLDRHSENIPDDKVREVDPNYREKVRQTFLNTLSHLQTVGHDVRFIEEPSLDVRVGFIVDDLVKAREESIQQINRCGGLESAEAQH